MCCCLLSYDSRRTLHLVLQKENQAKEEELPFEDVDFLEEFMASVLARGYEIFFFQAVIFSKQETIPTLFLTLNTKSISGLMKEQLDLLYFGKFPVSGLLQDYCMKSTIGEMLGFLRHLKSSKIREKLLKNGLSVEKYDIFLCKLEEKFASAAFECSCANESK